VIVCTMENRPPAGHVMAEALPLAFRQLGPAAFCGLLVLGALAGSSGGSTLGRQLLIAIVQTSPPAADLGSRTGKIGRTGPVEDPVFFGGSGLKVKFRVG